MFKLTKNKSQLFNIIIFIFLIIIIITCAEMDRKFNSKMIKIIIQ